MLKHDSFAAEYGMLLENEVPEGEYIRIMQGDILSLFAGANLAMTELDNNQTCDQENLSIECISRVLFMKDDFNKELAILKRKQPINCILSDGEFAKSGSSTRTFFIKTVVEAQ